MTDTATSLPPRRFGRLTAILFVLLAGLLPAMPAAAQTLPAPAAAETAAPPPLSAAELNAFADRLQDEAERQKLITSLRALAAARDAESETAEPGLAEDPGQAIIDGVLDQMRRAGSAFAAMGALFADLPAIAEWAERQIDDPRRRALWADMLVKLGATLLAATILFLLARWAVRRPLAALRTPRHGAPSLWLQFVLTILRAIVALVPITVFAITAYGMLELLASSGGTRRLAQIVVLAFVAHYAIGIVADKLLNQGRPLRLLRLDEENAHYALLWVRRLSALGIYGYAVVRIAERVRIPPDGVDTIAKLIGFAFAALLAVLILQIRQPVASRIRGDLPPTEAEPAEAMPVTPDPAAPSVAKDPEQSRTWRVLRQRLGDIWHVLALLYIAATYGVWAFAVSDGFAIILRGTLLTIVILFAVRVLRFAAERGFARLFAVSAETRRRFPGLEARANRYLPLLIGVIRAVIYVMAVFAILQAWGIDTVGWLASDLGRGIVARTVTILLVLLVTLALWEAIATGIEYYLTQPGPDGQPAVRSGRVRTLLPLLRRTVSIVLGVIAGLIVLSELGLNIAPLLAGAGVIGLAIGFGAQTLVKDVITGTFILTEDTISVGDIVDLGGNAGVVEDISIRTISLRDADGIVHTIPYSEVTKIKNMTRGYAQAVFDLRVSYREDIDEIFAVLEKLAAEFREEPDWNARILAPFEIWGVDSLGESAVVIRARFKTLPAQQWSVKREFQKRIKKRFDELGIEIPRPHRTIYFGEDRKGNAPPLRIRQEGASATGQVPDEDAGGS